MTSYFSRFLARSAAAMLAALMLAAAASFPAPAAAQTSDAGAPAALSAEELDQLLAPLLRQLISLLQELVVRLAAEQGVAVPSIAQNTEPARPAAGGGGGGGSANARPSITLAGPQELLVTVGGTFSDPGASAHDPEDGNLSSSIAVSGSVNLSVPGTYTLSYNVSDSRGRAAETRTRTVIVLTGEAQEPEYALGTLGVPANLSISSKSFGGDGEEIPDEPDGKPSFVSAVIDPLHVYVGDTQTFTVTVAAAGAEDPVVSVVSATELDTATLDLPLAKVSESGSQSTWSASWVVYDTHVQTYHTTFVARTQSGQESSITLAWSDPCTGVTHGTNSTLGADCTVSAVDGLDMGNLVIPEGRTLTINSGGNWAWNNERTITVNGAIVKNSGGQLSKGNLFCVGGTNDGANCATLVFNTASTLSGHVRRGTWFRFGSSLGVVPGSTQISSTVTVGGITSGSTATFGGTNGGNRCYRINGGTCTSISSFPTATLNPGDTVSVSLQTTITPEDSHTISMTVGGLTSTWIVVNRSDEGPGCDPVCS